MLVDQDYKGHGVKDQKVTIVGKNIKQAGIVLKKLMKRRAAIEPLIGHAKNDGGITRNHLLGKSVDQITALMMAIGFNFIKITRRISSALYYLFLKIFVCCLKWIEINLSVLNLNH